MLEKLNPAWGTSPGTIDLKFAALLYSQQSALCNGSVVPIVQKTKALGVLGTQVRLSRTPLLRTNSALPGEQPPVELGWSPALRSNLCRPTYHGHFMTALDRAH
jgi:hypothetical protein